MLRCKSIEIWKICVVWVPLGPAASDDIYPFASIFLPLTKMFPFIPQTHPLHSRYMVHKHHKTFHVFRTNGKDFKRFEEFRYFGHNSWFWPHFTALIRFKNLTRFHNLDLKWSLLKFHQLVGEKEKLYVVCEEVTSGICNIKVMFLDHVMPYRVLVLLKI